MSAHNEILVGVDGSAESRAALSWAVTEAAARDARLSVVHVCDPSRYTLWKTPEQVQAGLAEAAQPIVDEAVALVGEQDRQVRVTGQVVLGSPPRRLVNLSEGSDLVVLGCRHHGPVSRMLGSVSQLVVTHAHGPVVLVGPSAAPVGTNRVVVGVGGPHANEAELGYAFAAAEQRSLPLLAVHTWPVAVWPGAGIPVQPGHPVHDAEVARDYLSATLAPWRARYPAVDVTAEARPGDPRQVIESVCRPSDLLVLGHHRHAHWLNISMGPVAAGLLEEASCPVVIVPDQPREALIS